MGSDSLKHGNVWIRVLSSTIWGETIELLQSRIVPEMYEGEGGIFKIKNEHTGKEIVCVGRNSADWYFVGCQRALVTNVMGARA